MMSNETVCAVSSRKLVKGIDTLVRDGVISVNEAREMLKLKPYQTDRIVDMGTRCVR